jgi:hypothetical protein
MNMKGDSALRSHARAECNAGELPIDRPGKLWAGAGSGASCSLCERAITDADVEYEMESSLGTGLQVFRFHLPCYYIWSAEGKGR